MFARRIFIDVYISMFIGLTLLFFVLAERYPERRRTSWSSCTSPPASGC